MKKSIVTGIYGSSINFEDLASSTVVILDVFHRLSNITRYNGGTKIPISVAQHSLAIEKVLRQEGASDEVCLLALLHDSTEAFMGDLITPLKHHFPEYVELEDALFDVIVKSIEVDITFTEEQWAEVKRHDKAIRLAEWIYLNDGQFYDCAGAWSAVYGENPTPDPKYIKALESHINVAPDITMGRLLGRFWHLVFRILGARNGKEKRLSS